MISKISGSPEVDQTSRIEKIIANFKQRAKVSSYLLTVQLSNINHINLQQEEGYRTTEQTTVHKHNLHHSGDLGSDGESKHHRFKYFIELTILRPGYYSNKKMLVLLT